MTEECRHDWAHHDWLVVHRVSGGDADITEYEETLYEVCICTLCGVKLHEEQATTEYYEGEEPDEEEPVR